jgi:hypothetical protein
MAEGHNKFITTFVKMYSKKLKAWHLSWVFQDLTLK